jgi:hypothetical protein
MKSAFQRIETSFTPTHVFFVDMSTTTRHIKVSPFFMAVQAKRSLIRPWNVKMDLTYTSFRRNKDWSLNLGEGPEFFAETL